MDARHYSGQVLHASWCNDLSAFVVTPLIRQLDYRVGGTYR